MIDANKQIRFIDIGTLDQFISKNRQSMTQIFKHPNIDSMGGGLLVGITADGKVEEEDNFLFSCSDLSINNYKDSRWTTDKIVDNLLTTYYKECQLRMEEQKHADSKGLKQACLYESRMFTAKSYADYIITNLEIIDPDDIEWGTILDTKHYGLYKLIAKLDAYYVVNIDLCKILIAYCLSYKSKISFLPNKELDRELLYVLIKKLYDNMSVIKLDINQLGFAKTDIDNLFNFDEKNTDQSDDDDLPF